MDRGSTLNDAEVTYPERMPDRIMYFQLKTGYDLDRGPAWIGSVRFSKTWRTAYFHDRTLARVTGTARANVDGDANFYDVDTGDLYWISGPKRDRTDGRYSAQQPTVESEVKIQYEAFLTGAPLPGREEG